MNLEKNELNTFNRINTFLKKEGKKMHKSKPGGEVSNLGTFHVVDTFTNTVIDSHIEDLDKYYLECLEEKRKQEIAVIEEIANTKNDEHYVKIDLAQVQKDTINSFLEQERKKKEEIKTKTDEHYVSPIYKTTIKDGNIYIDRIN